MEKVTKFVGRGSDSEATGGNSIATDQSTNTDELFAQVHASMEKLRRNIRPTSSGSSRSNHDDSSGSSKFAEELMYDPITYELMVDPVKGSDGRTYDRWTILNNDLRVSPVTGEQLSILCDDINVRSLLFETFRSQNLEEKFNKLRQEYRRTTLNLVEEEQYGEALERLEHVLKWDPKDSECLALRAELPNRLETLLSGSLDRSTSTPFPGSSGSDPDHAAAAEGEAIAKKPTSSPQCDVVVSVEGRTEASPEPRLNHDPSGDVKPSLPARQLEPEESVCWAVAGIMAFGICYIPRALLVTLLLPFIFLWRFIIEGKTAQEILVECPDVYYCRFEDADD